jgi:hypothetical protein
MKLPNFTPQNRFTTPSRTAGLGRGVTPSDGCGTGKWCCQTISGKACFECAIKDPIFGKCLEPHEVTCARNLSLPTEGC